MNIIKHHAALLGMLALILATNGTASAQDTPLRVQAAAAASGDGRSLTAVSISGGPSADSEELTAYPELPHLECAGAAVLPANGDAQSMILAPAVRRATTLKCQAELRGVRRAFTLKLQAPGPGLYAQTSLRAGATPSLELRPFSLPALRSAKASARYRASASVGQTSAATDGRLTIALPASKAPRALAVAITDGTQGGAVFLPLPGKTRLPVLSKARAQVRIRIAGRWFGPVRARRGGTPIDIVVPPGVRDAVVEARDRRGNRKENFTDLRTPSLPRIAAVATSESVQAGKELVVYVALASPRGGPAGAEAKIRASAPQGELSPAVSQGGGLWLLRYRATGVLGQQEITITVDGQDDAGVARVPVEVRPGPTSAINITLAEGPRSPGSAITGVVQAVDGFGNASAGPEEVQLQFNGASVPLRAKPEGLHFASTIPLRLPEDRTLVLLAKVQDLSEERRMEAVPDPAAQASLRYRPDGRHGTLVASVFDRHGNPVPAQAFQIVSDQARVGTAIGDANEHRLHVQAHPRARSATLRVLADGAELDRIRASFSPPAHAVLLGAYASGGWTSNGGDLDLPRAGVGLVLRKSFASVESGLLLGVEGFAARDSLQAEIDSMPLAMSRQLSGLAIPLLLRARLPLGTRVGIGAAFGVVPVSTRTSLTIDNQPELHHSSWTLGGRVQVGADLRVGSGRLTLSAQLGRTQLREGPVVGDIDGLGATLSYELWPFDLSE